MMRLWSRWGKGRVPIDAQGVWMQDYFGAALRNDAQTFSTVSFVDVVEGRFDNALFDDKIVLVGLVSSQGALDNILCLHHKQANSWQGWRFKQMRSKASCKTVC
jgi:hypothetical protein